MASSDDEEDAVPQIVSDYHFVNDKDEPVAFSELPLQWKENEQLGGNRKAVYLHGRADSGLKKIFKRVTAWRFDVSNVKPEISVLCKDETWINLQKPRKSYESTIRTILITIHCLHYVNKNPEISGRSLWDNLSKVLSMYVSPSENDLADHTSLISEAIKRDETLAKAKFLVNFLENPKKRKKVFAEDDQNTARFIVEDDEEIEDDGSDDEDDLFDSVCSICDNGGELLCCEGRCMRSFHATVEAGIESKCESLELSVEQVEAIQNFVCKNCQYKQHQCFVCGRLGSSDKSSGAEVFSCVSATCGRFYHPRCVAKLLPHENAVEAKELQKKIADGESFTCPIHKCFVCKQGEDKTNVDLQFAVCRRCPKSYHRKCLPREIGLEDDEDNDIYQRGWEDLIPDRILIYCLDHEIDDDIGTPVRNHIEFPDDGRKKKKLDTEQLLRKEKIPGKQISVSAEVASRKRHLEKSKKGADLPSKIRESEPSTGNGRRLFGSSSSKKQKLADSSRKPSPGTAALNVKKSFPAKKEPSLGERLYVLVKGESPDEESPNDEQKKPMTKKPIAKELYSSVQLDADEKKRILAVMKEASSSITMEQILEKHSGPSTHAALSRNGIDKNVTVGKVEGAVEAIRAALQKLEKGCSIDDAKAVCEPGLLRQIDKWKNKLKQYLTPFLLGMRYTSFGRHFTQVDKLKEIVDRLHYYVQDDDMIVDFCCGSNDFSCLMKKKLDEVGKKCSYKNYDILQAKDDFNFERRDWMTVQPKELPPGSQLIMGLNPPFGMNCVLANKFIDKALEFKPKLIILIVPQETKRLDQKRDPYDLIWEDNVLLAGKSFYFPGSVDVNDNQIEDWNNNPPPLSLWSRPDWTTKHKAIARQQGHLSRLLEYPEAGREEPPISNHPSEDHDLPLIERNEVPKQVLEKVARPSESPKEAPPRQSDERPVHHQGGGGGSSGKDQSNQSAKKRKRNRGKRERGGPEEGSQRGNDREQERHRDRHSPPADVRSLERHRDRRSTPADVRSLDHRDRRSPPDVRSLDHRNRRSPPEVRSLDHHHHRSSPMTFEAPSRSEANNGVGPTFDQNLAPHRPSYETGYGRPTGVDETLGSYRMNGADPHIGGGFGPRNSVERFVGYDRESTDSLRSGAIFSEIEDRQAMDFALRSHIQPYGPPEPFIAAAAYGQRSGIFIGGPEPPMIPPPYSHFGSAADAPPYGRPHTSTMQRYAPQLDELNHSHRMMNNFRPEPPVPGPRNGYPDPMGARLPGYPTESLGYATGPHRSLSQNNSSGWLPD